MSNTIKKLINNLEEILLSSSKVFIVGHNNSDYDSVASAIGMARICKELNIEAYIIINDSDIMLEPGIKTIIDKEKNNYNIIKLRHFKKIKDKKSSLITVDVNNKNLLSVKDYVDEFNNILIIDHHEESKDTIITDKKIIETHASSTSEIVSDLLNNYKVKYDKDLASYLLAGIILDTQRYIKNTSSKTHDITKKLLNRGADSDYVNNLFLTEFDNDKEISLLLYRNDNTKFVNYNYTGLDEYNLPLFNEYNISFTFNRNNSNKIYKRIYIAKAADKMLDYRVDAAFVMGYIDKNTVAISGRSKGKIDVGQVMQHISGGGNTQNAAAIIENCDNIEKLEQELIQKIEWGVNLEKEDFKKLVKKL